MTGTVGGHSFSASTGQLPSGFPSGIPVPKDSRVLGGGGVGSNYDVAFAVHGSLASATTAYQGQLRAAGFTVSDVQSGSAGSASGTSFTATNAKYQLQVAAGSTGTAPTDSALKPGEFPLSLTVTPASG